MKRIAILTFLYPSNRNFGAILQAFAVNKLFKKSRLINYKPMKESIKSKILFYIGGKNFIEFYNKFLETTTHFKNITELINLNEEFDIFVVGSDQVWRPKWLQDKLPHYYFDFVNDDKKKIAYAASFGVNFWEGDESLTNKIKPLAQKFDYVSVREESGIKICKDIFNIEAKCVLDPTLMIGKEDYKIILDDWKDKSHLEKKYIAHMLLDDTEELREESENIGKYLKADINYIKGKERKILGKKITFYNKVSQWLTYLKDSELVITDSFHCTVFSLIFNKKFVVVANPGRGTARLKNLLKIAGLENRFFTNIKDVLKSEILEEDIDYKQVEEKLDVHRKYSMDFLKEALGEDNE